MLLTIGSIEDNDFFRFIGPHTNLHLGIMIALLLVMAATNVTTSSFITARLIYAHRILKTSQGSARYGNSPYLNGIAVCVESSAMIACTAIVISAFYLKHSWYYLYALAALPQICVSSQSVCNRGHLINTASGYVAPAHHLSDFLGPSNQHLRYRGDAPDWEHRICAQSRRDSML